MQGRDSTSIEVVRILYIDVPVCPDWSFFVNSKILVLEVFSVLSEIFDIPPLI